MIYGRKVIQVIKKLAGQTLFNHSHLNKSERNSIPEMPMKSYYYLGDPLPVSLFETLFGVEEVIALLLGIVVSQIRIGSRRRLGLWCSGSGGRGGGGSRSGGGGQIIILGAVNIVFIILVIVVVLIVHVDGLGLFIIEFVFNGGGSRIVIIIDIIVVVVVFIIFIVVVVIFVILGRFGFERLGDRGDVVQSGGSRAANEFDTGEEIHSAGQQDSKGSKFEITSRAGGGGCGVPLVVGPATAGVVDVIKDALFGDQQGFALESSFYKATTQKM